MAGLNVNGLDVNGLDVTGLEVKWPVPHLEQVHSSWKKYQQLRKQGTFSIDGHSLDIASLVALVRCVYSKSQPCLLHY